jgi:hypothetical protein
MQGEPDPTPYVSFCENPPSKSARGLAHSGTLPRCFVAFSLAKRPGVRQPSAALATPANEPLQMGQSRYFNPVVLSESGLTPFT